MIDSIPEKIDPLKIAADLLQAIPFDCNDAIDLAARAMRRGAIAIRQLFDENAKLKGRLAEIARIMDESDQWLSPNESNDIHKLAKGSE